jgi:hypothetical protein
MAAPWPGIEACGQNPDAGHLINFAWFLQGWAHKGLGPESKTPGKAGRFIGAGALII